MGSATQPKRYVIIGNGVAGTTAAETLRKADPQASITIIGNEPYPLYNRIALFPVLKLRTPPERIIIRSLDYHREHRLDLLLETNATHVDVDQRIVSTEPGGDRPYDALLVASGGRPSPLQVPGAEGTYGIHNYQSLDDTKGIMARMLESRQMVVVGGSYIAYELASAARSRGLEVTWLIRGPHFVRRILDPEGGALVDRIARDAGVDVQYGEEVARVQAKNGVIQAVTTTGGRSIPCDLLGVGIGLIPNTNFLEGTPVEVQQGVVVNQYLETGAPGVYGAGDVAEFYDTYVNRHHLMGTWNNAAAHGRLAAANMLGGRQSYSEVPYHTSTLFDTTMAVVGTTPDVRPDLEFESLIHVDSAARLYRRLFFLEGRLVGAALIGDIRARRQLTDRIRSRERIAPAERAKLLQA